ncbi:MAG: pectate lyase [Gemmataceae bacterium]
MNRSFALVVLAVSIVGKVHAQPEDALRNDALQAMKKAATYYRSKVASHGGYVYYYAPDLKERWGEGKAGPDTIFVQPPGTPTVGMAYLKAYEATKDAFCLDAARETAQALVAGQLQSGGWTQVIHFAKPERGKLGKYRKGMAGSWNFSSLDDDQTQAALQLLMRVDQALDFKHVEIHEAAEFGSNALLKAQFANGGFPQGWLGPTDRKVAGKASYPEYDWRTDRKVREYWNYCTLNDNLAGTVADVLIEAHQIYKDDRYQAALRKLGDFLVAAQMPDPQPGWCQQYSDAMIPIWARKFEPPAITGWESQDAMRTLIRIAAYTGKKEYLEPIPRSLAYFRKSLLPDGKVARFYELKTNRPLYMDAQYRLTYDASAAPGHYGWTQPARFDDIERMMKTVERGESVAPSRRYASIVEARKIIEALDEQGRWISTYAGERLVGQPRFADGFRYLSSDVFSRNMETLSEFVRPSAN